MNDNDPIDDVLADNPHDLRDQAVRRLKKRRDFHAHAFVYVVINAFLWGIWAVIAVSSDDNWYPWPIWVTLGWGIGLAFNAWDVFMRKPMTEADIEREIERIAGKT